MIKEFVKADTEIVINKRGQRAVSIDGQDAILAPRLLNFEMDGLNNVFVISDLEDGCKIQVSNLAKGGYNILYSINIDIEEAIGAKKLDYDINTEKYLNEIIHDGKIMELYPYLKGYVEASIDYILDNISEYRRGI